MPKLSREEREILYGRHSPAGYDYLQSKKVRKVKKLKRVKQTVKPLKKQKKIE